MTPARQWTIDALLKERCTEVGKCFEWLGSCGSGGHPMMSFNGQPVLARRVAWVLDKGLALSDINGLRVWPACANRLCISPKCAKCGTHRQMFDCLIAAGRTVATPSRCAAATRSARAGSNLTMDDARAIRQAIRDGVTREVLAARYSKSDSLIDKIWHNKAWRETVQGASVFSMVPA